MIKKSRASIKWQLAVKQASQLTDKLGRGMDPEMVGVVAALGLAGFTTRLSCSGHIDRDTLGPYVTFASKNKSAQTGLYELLDSFYESRLPVKYTDRLIVRTFKSVPPQLMCQGSDLTADLPVSKRAAQLKRHLKEFTDFGNFLKDIFI